MNKKQKKILYRIIIAAALLVVIGLVSLLLTLPKVIRFLLYLIPYLVIGHDILLKAWKGIRNKQVFDECFLMTVATIGAFAVGEYVEGAAVMLFYQIGELFQSVAVGKSRTSIGELMDIRPDVAYIENENGEIEEVDPDEVEIGTEIVVRPGEKVPIDGIIVKGQSALDTSALTGESVPRTVRVGDEALSGSINTIGLLSIRTTKEFGESTASKILELVENASSKKSRSENFISKFARYYTPAVCYSALALAILPPVFLLIFGFAPMWIEWITRALTFLVISCPCALVISIPLTFFAGIGGASRAGVLVKGSCYLETLSKVDCILFDKTGTMTEGVFAVTELHPAEGVSEAALLEKAALAEEFSSHPIALSLREAYQKEIDAARISDAHEISGQGVQAVVDGRTVSVGNARLMGDAITQARTQDGDMPHAGTLVYVSEDDCYLGYILISDRIKKTAAQGIQDLKSIGIKKIIMLTGDRKETAEAVAKQLSIPQVFSELMPEDKVSKVEQVILSESGKGRTVSFVGDGINDAPVLTRADVGIAMGGIGSDAAIEAADVVLMDDDPVKIAKSVRIARKCMRIVYENIVFAIGVKFICLILGAFGIANMWMAIFADVGVMVIAVLNAIRALKVE